MWSWNEIWFCKGCSFCWRSCNFLALHRKVKVNHFLKNMYFNIQTNPFQEIVVIDGGSLDQSVQGNFSLIVNLIWIQKFWFIFRKLHFKATLKEALDYCHNAFDRKDIKQHFKEDISNLLTIGKISELQDHHHSKVLINSLKYR